MIAGAGSVGRSIAKELTTRGHGVTIVDSDPKAMRVARVPQADWVLADACELSTLADIDLSTCDVVVAATGDDKANLVLSLLAKTEFGVPRVVARVNNPANEWLFDEQWGVDYPVSTPRIMTMIIEGAVSSGELVRRLDFYESGAGLYQATVPAGAVADGTAVASLLLPQGILLTTVLRDGVPFVPEPDLTITAEDQLLFVVSKEGEEDIPLVQALVSPPAQLTDQLTDSEATPSTDSKAVPSDRDAAD
ncbi:MAG: TrkA family potassium uptake protein [Arcanobacterium sp.]|nr:TrkA family potassium uptake protein [Arcanobacterium sp.]